MQARRSVRVSRSAAAAITFVMCSLLVVGPAAAAAIKLGAPAALEVEGREAFAIGAEVRVPAEVAGQVAKVRTSPFDVAKLPIGEYSVGLLEKNLSRVFGGITTEDPGKETARAAVVVELGIEQFEAKIPTPAYKPYTASVVYSVRIVAADGQTLLEQVATASAQTSSGMMSGFRAKRLAGEAATGAMNDAMTRLLEGLLDSEELAALEAGPEAGEPGAGESQAAVQTEEVSDAGGRGTCAGPR